MELPHLNLLLNEADKEDALFGAMYTKLTHMSLNYGKGAECEEGLRGLGITESSVLSAVTSSKSVSPGQTQLNPGMKQRVSRGAGAEQRPEPIRVSGWHKL